MTMELINGPASESAASDGFFNGTTSPRRLSIPNHLRESADKFIGEARQGRKGYREMVEAFSTSDFTLAAFANIDTETLAQYAELPSVWRSYTAVTTVNDFRPKRLQEKWANQVGLPLVPELTEFPIALQGAHNEFWINVAKYGLRDAISFEAFKNNEAIDELENIPSKYARAAGELETINALANLLAVDPLTNLANGVNTGFFKNYTSGRYSGLNTTPDNKPLTAANLDAVLSQMATRKSPNNGRLIAQPDLTVVVPKALEWQMRKIQALRAIEVTDTATNTKSVYDNYLATTDFVVEPMLDSINTNAKASGTWFVLPKPTAARPATFAAFLRGYETPDLRVKADTGARIGGGTIAAQEGSFDIDDIQYRVRHIVGRQQGDPTFTYASTGS